MEISRNVYTVYRQWVEWKMQTGNPASGMELGYKE